MRLIRLPLRHERTAARIRTQLQTFIVSRLARILSCWLLVTGVTLLLVCLLGATSAQAAEPGQLLALAKSVNAVLDNIRNWIMGILAGLATVFLTLGGVRYVMAGGDPGEVEKAKASFKSAGWGYGLAALAPLVVQILKGIVGA
ncbi:pilin [Streptomyces hokutonensis]|uniref:pilin n=1 Tax=Streptomyces hokutonensis TaxID=1306990 RepID=UPI0038026BCC